MSAELLQTLATFPEVDGHRPWPRFRLTQDQWRDLTGSLAGDWCLLGLWADLDDIHLALRDELNGTVAVASVGVINGHYPAVSPMRPSASRLERMIHDLHGHVAADGVDGRPWLDHGRWPVVTPLRDPPPMASGDRPTALDYPFLKVEGDGLHQIPVGPIHAGIIEPGHFRFTANGETLARLEELLGWTHKGIERLMQGRTPAEAARIVCRLSGDSAVAHSWAFARAVEAALDQPAPPRAQWLRGLMAEVERVANHLGDIGAICNDAAFVFLHGQTAMLREQLLRVAARAFGHRLMFDAVVPGGVAVDPDLAALGDLRACVAAIRPRFAELVKIYDTKPSLSDRMVATGVVSSSLVHRFGAGGYVARASLRAVDARKLHPYTPYDMLDFEVPSFAEGDVNARVWIRIREVEASLKLIESIIDHLPPGAIQTDLTPGAGEGMALIEGFRGEILCWVRLDEQGLVARCHPRDPSWFTWPLLEAAVEGNIVADFPLCNKSFNCSYSGVDL